jgi:hypothetical protein
MNRFTDHLQVVTTSNSNTVADFHTVNRSTMGEKRNAYRIFVGKPERKRSLRRPRRRWVGNIKIDLREIRRDGVDWIDMAQIETSGGLL